MELSLNNFYVLAENFLLLTIESVSQFHRMFYTPLSSDMVIVFNLIGSQAQ